MKKFLALLLVVMLSLGCVGAVAEDAGSSLQELYSAAELLMVQGDYMGAAEKFEALATYSDASQMAMYCKAIAVAEMGMYGTAVEALNKLGDFKDCKQLAQYYAARSYEDAAALASVEAATDSELATSKENYEGAIARFSDLALYKDSLTRLMACKDAMAPIKTELIRRAQVQREAQYQQALSLEQAGDYEGAISIYEALGDYSDCKERIVSCQKCINENIYQQALSLEQAGDYKGAIAIYETLGDYSDCKERIEKCEEYEPIWGFEHTINSHFGESKAVAWNALKERKDDNAVQFYSYSANEHRGLGFGSCMGDSETSVNLYFNSTDERFVRYELLFSHDTSDECYQRIKTLLSEKYGEPAFSKADSTVSHMPYSKGNYVNHQEWIDGIKDTVYYRWYGNYEQWSIEQDNGDAILITLSIHSYGWNLYEESEPGYVYVDFEYYSAEILK